VAAVLATAALATVAAAELQLDRLPGAEPRNIVFILSDDHRWDAMSFMGHPFLSTPAMDAMARDGVHFENAFVTTSLCSPSRASILTGMYAHTHEVVNNQHRESEDLVFFPQYLRAAGYETAFVGKWHMGHAHDDPRKGFDHWVSFRGQGSYTPRQNLPININGKRVPQRGYITDELTGYAVDWLGERDRDKPFFLYLSHKAVHANFTPAARHRDRFKDVEVIPPPTQANTPENYAGKPRWVRTQRNSTHGVDYPDQETIPLQVKYKQYCETLLAVDESIARVLEELERQEILDSTLVLYMGDNGYAWGEHGLQDKRTGYEESMRVPLLGQCPELYEGGTKVTGMVLNIDIAPTLLAAAGLRAPDEMQGRSFLDLARGKESKWRDYFLYEYFWERNYPQTPTLHAIRTDRYKYIHYNGVYDTDELYDIQADPLERRNLIADEEHQPRVQRLNDLLFDTLEASGGMYIPLYRDRGLPQVLRRTDRSKPGEFPEWMMRDEPGTPD
jgi:N-acetylglucosamine-6-sulfatase